MTPEEIFSWQELSPSMQPRIRDALDRVRAQGFGTSFEAEPGVWLAWVYVLSIGLLAGNVQGEVRHYVESSMARVIDLLGEHDPVFKEFLIGLRETMAKRWAEAMKK